MKKFEAIDPTCDFTNEKKNTVDGWVFLSICTQEMFSLSLDYILVIRASRPDLLIANQSKGKTFPRNADQRLTKTKSTTILDKL